MSKADAIIHNQTNLRLLQLPHEVLALIIGHSIPDEETTFLRPETLALFNLLTREDSDSSSDESSSYAPHADDISMLTNSRPRPMEGEAKTRFERSALLNLSLSCSHMACCVEDYVQSSSTQAQHASRDQNQPARSSLRSALEAMPDVTITRGGQTSIVSSSFREDTINEIEELTGEFGNVAFDGMQDWRIIGDEIRITIPRY